MKNIFEDAKFGDRFITRDGRIAVVVNVRKESIQLFVENEISPTVYEIRCNGWANCYKDKPDYKWKSDVDIVSRYQEHIDEDCLDKLADDYIDIINNGPYTDNYIPKYISFKDIYNFIKTGFIDGYRKAKEK